LQAGSHKTPKVGEFIAFEPIHQINILLRQFEGCLFKGPLAWRVLHHEPKVDMQKVSVSRKHDVAVVTVFHIENVTEDRVAGK
jgi:hypothetical protein